MKASASATPVAHHLLANVLGRGWAFLSTLLFVPLYVHLLGIEGFGIIALYLAVSGVVALLDLGFSPTLARELHDQGRNAEQKASLLFTYEIAYAAIVATLAACALLLPIDAFALLLTREDLARPEAAAAIRLVFVAALVQMQLFFYVAGLLGIEEQTKANMVIIGAGIARSALVLVPLWLHPTPALYLLWQIVFAIVFAALARRLLYAAVWRDAAARHATFRARLIRENLTFTAGMFLVSLTAAVNAQLDKLLMSRFAGIGALAEYSLVSSFSQLMVFIVSPVTIAMLPRFVHSATSDDVQELRALFAVSYKLVGALVAAALGSMLFFGPFVISMWTVNRVDAASIAVYSAPLIVGYALLALGTVPHSIAIARKSLRGSMVISATLLATVPAYWLLIQRHGALGAAFTWLALQVAVVPAYTCWVNKNFIGMKHVVRSLLVPALLLPLLVSAACNLIASGLVSDSRAPAVNLAIIVGAGLVAGCGCVLVALRRADIDYLFGHVRPSPT